MASAAGLPVSVDGVVPSVAVQVSAAAAEDLIHDGAVVIDVREEDEWAAGHAPGSVLIPMAQLETRLEEIKGERALIVCRSGGRSDAMAQLLSSRGINAVNLAGGLRAWEGAGLPVVTDSGEAGRII